MSFNRRTFLKLSGASVVLVAAGGGYLALSPQIDRAELSIDALLRQLDRFTGKPLQATGAWTPAQIFSHCAQSVEFAMSGFPQSKPPLFQNTLGALAFTVFSRRGAMTHPLDEPIPGAPSLEAEQDPSLALARLQKVLLRFQAYDRHLAPHFAFGALSKADYELAHVLHIQNHLPEIAVQSL